MTSIGVENDDEAAPVKAVKDPFTLFAAVVIRPATVPAL